MSHAAPARTPRSRAISRPVVLAVDAVLVVVFAAIGYATHADALTLAGVASTAWPFLVALAAAHAVLLVAGRPAAEVLSGLLVWVVTVGGGMLVRRVAGDGTATAFIVVAAVFNLVTLVGWRALARLARG